MDKKTLIERYKNGERNFVGVNLSEANLSGADLSYANLSKANIWNADLSEANLNCANLSFANLSDADLNDADLNCASLSKANLSYANLSGTALWYANLSFANLGYANLGYANLGFADLRSANLEGSNLEGADLSNANLSWANLSGTVLDPANEFDPLSEEEFLRAGFEVEGGRVVGYRTKRSTICGNTTYVPGETYTAPVFSTDIETECHPGIYLAPLKWVKNVYPRCSLVKVSAAIPDVLKCGDKWRAREVFVIEDCEERSDG